MKYPLCLALAMMLACAAQPSAQGAFEADTLSTPEGDLAVTFIGHGTLMFAFKGVVIHVDPWGSLADYSKLPTADIVLITHDHPDHLDLDALTKVQGHETVVIMTRACEKKGARGVVMKNGDTVTVAGITIEAVPAYNIVAKRPDGRPYHAKGEGNGYVIGFGPVRVYVAGDTENIPEMKRLGPIDVAFLPMNLPYTMTPEMAAEAAIAVAPKILYPYHFGETDTAALTRLLAERREIEVRIRTMR